MKRKVVTEEAKQKPVNTPRTPTLPTLVGVAKEGEVAYSKERKSWIDSRTIIFYCRRWGLG